MLSQGVPMLTAGDEVRRTQNGNNNAYCQDSPLSWFDWSLVEKHNDLKRFCSALIRFRRQEATLRRREFYSGMPQTPGALPDISWFNQYGGTIDWTTAKQSSFTCVLNALDVSQDRELTSETRALSETLGSTLPFDPLVEAYPEAQYYILAMFNPTDDAQTFYFPIVAKFPSFSWRLFVDTAARAPNDVYPELNGPEVSIDAGVLLPEHSMRVYISRKLA